MINWLRVKNWLKDIWKIRGGYERFPDQYGLSRDIALDGAEKAINQCQTRDDLILVLVHFQKTFEMTQRWLESRSIEYLIGPAKLTPEGVLDLADRNRGTVCLSLCQTLDETSLDRQIPVARKFSLAVIILERHPLISQDQKIDHLLRVWPFMVRVGYFLSVDQALLKYCLRPEFIDLLKQIGFDEQKLITSGAISRRLDIVQQRLVGKMHSNSVEFSVSSPEEWFDSFSSEFAVVPKGTAI